MAQPTITEQLESIIREGAAYPYDGRITQVYANTVNVKLNGSRTIVRDVALPEHIKSEDLAPGMAVRLVQTVGKPTVVAVYEQFNDPEMFNYAGIGSRVPTTPNVTVKATKNGWLVTWNAVTGATKYILYKNDTPNEDSPEEVAQMGAAQRSYTVGYDENGLFRYFAVKACSGLLESEVSLWLTDQTPPAAPVWKTHTYLPSGHYLEWTHPDKNDVKEFIIYRNTVAADEGAIEVTRTPNLNTLVDYTGEGDWFGVQAVDWSDLNRSAIVWTGQAYDPTPAAPVPTANMVEGGGFVVNWAAIVGPPPAGGYEVQSAGDTGDPETYVSEWSGQALTSPVIARVGVSRFRVRAQGYDASWSDWSSWVTDSNPPPQPTMIVTTGASSLMISLTTTDASHSSIGFSHYVLEQAGSQSGQGAIILDNHAVYGSFPRIVNPLTPGVPKYFRLIPYDWAGNAGEPTAWTVGIPVAYEGANTSVQDKFDGYGGRSTSPLESMYWLQLLQGMDSGTWEYHPVIGGAIVDPSIQSTTHPLEGSTHLHKPGSCTGIAGQVSLDLSQDGRFTDDDYVVFHAAHGTVWKIDGDTVAIRLYSDAARENFFYKTFDLQGERIETPPIVYGYDQYYAYAAKKSDFQTVGTPDWSTIVAIGIGAGDNVEIDLDDIRIVKADPDNPDSYNDTWNAWDHAASTSTNKGIWNIYPGNRTGEPAKPFSYGQVGVVSSPSAWYLAHKPVTTVDIYRGAIQAGIYLKGSDGKGGLSFFVKDVALDSWDMYAIEADSAADTVTLVKWVAGIRTEIGSASFAFNPGQILWLGADFSEYDTDAGRIKVYASLTEGNLIQAANLRISAQDAEVGSGGTVGLLSNQSNMRFVNFTAGSPAHAEVADVAKSLDGPVIVGETKRLVYDASNNRWAHTSDGGVTLTPLDAGNAAQLGGVAAANYLQRTSANRPGVTRLYRRDNDSNYNVQTHWDNTRWLLQGYNGDTYHAPCRVAYADTVEGYGSTSLRSYGCKVIRTSDFSIATGAWRLINPFSGYIENPYSLTWWDSASALYANAGTGWYLVSFSGQATSTAQVWLQMGIQVNGGWRVLDECVAPTTGATLYFNFATPIYLTSGQYCQIYCNQVSSQAITLKYVANYSPLFGLTWLGA